MRTQKKKGKINIAKLLKSIFILFVFIYSLYMFIDINIDIFTKMTFVEFMNY